MATVFYYATYLILIATIVQSQNITQYIELFSDELASIMCDGIRLGGDKCGNKIYGVQDFINSFQPYFDNGIEDASILSDTIINRLNSQLNIRASFIETMASLLETKCLNYNSNSEYLLSFDSLYFAGNDDRDAILPDDLEYNEAQNREVSLSASTYKLPNSVSYKNKHIQRDAQVSELLDSTMRELYQSHCKTDAGNDEYCSMYFGSFNGIFRRYPGTENSKTNDEYNDYDPRFRPWYVSAASGGGKDIVILIDRGYFMDDGILSLAKTAVSAILKTLGPSSFVNVVAFASSTTLSCFGEKLVPATERNVEELLSFVEKLKIDDSWNWYDYPDFPQALNKAFDILLKETNIINCRPAILLFTNGAYPQCDECDTPDVGATISKRNYDLNAVIFSYQLGKCYYVEDSDCNYVPKQASDKTKGVFNQISSAGDHLVTKLSSFYLYYSYGSEGRNIIVTSPYQDFDTKTIMITMAKSVYIDEKYFVGVVGTDIPLTFLADAIGDITIGPKSYTFIMNQASELLLHPAIADDSQLFSGTTGNTYAAIPVTDVEPDEFTQNVLQTMLTRQYGQMKIFAQVKQAAGSVEYNGYIHEEANLLYIYSGVGPASLSIAIVIYTESDINIPYVPSFGMSTQSLNTLNIANCEESTDIFDCLAGFTLYHRLDLLSQCDLPWIDQAQILNGPKMNANDEYYNEFFSDVIYSVKYPIYYLQSGIYESQIDALNVNPSCKQLEKLEQVTNRVYEQLEKLHVNMTLIYNNLPFGGIRNEISLNILNSIYSLTSLHEFWKDAFLADDSSFVSVFFGHYQGLHISYPGKIFKTTYNPLLRPWYQRAKSYPDLFVWTTPYSHAVTNKLVTGASTVITSPYSEYTFGVMGFNYEYSEFVTYWQAAMNDVCNKENDQYCFLIDSSGFLLYYDGMEFDVTHSDISRKFLGDLEPTLMQSLLERKFFIKDINANFKLDSLDISYIVDEDVFFNGNFEDTPTSFAYNTGTYIVYSISKTNLYLIYVENYDFGLYVYPRDCPYNELCSLVKSPGCIKQEEIEKIFIFKQIVESATKCEILTLDVCTEPETAPLVSSCSSSDTNFTICIREDNKQTDICSANCDAANVMHIFYLNVIVCSVFIIFL